MGSRTPARNICDRLYKSGIRFISGKWFKFNVDGQCKEIIHFQKYLYYIKELKTFIGDSNDTRRVINTFVEMYGESGWWPEMPIIAEARALKETREPCFPLTHKQLILIKRLVLGDSEYMYILCGVGGSGKSTFANIIVQIFNNDVSSLTLEDLSCDFKMAQGVNSRLIYADELNADDIDNGIIKTLVSKQEVTINPKNETPYQARWQGTMLFSCNNAPYMDLKDSGMIRRICYVNMDEKIKNPDPKMQKKIYSHEDLVNIVALALKEDDTNWFDCFKYETRELLKKNNNVWLSRDLVVGVKDTPYESYKTNANRQGLKVMSEPNFLKVREVLGQWEKEEDEELPF